jgi:hypothetical protein
MGKKWDYDIYSWCVCVCVCVSVWVVCVPPYKNFSHLFDFREKRYGRYAIKSNCNFVSFNFLVTNDNMADVRTYAVTATLAPLTLYEPEIIYDNTSLDNMYIYWQVFLECKIITWRPRESL